MPWPRNYAPLGGTLLSAAVASLPVVGLLVEPVALLEAYAFPQAVPR